MSAPDITVCCICHRQRVGPGKAEIYADPPAGGYPENVVISHTYCPPCAFERFGVEPEEANTCAHGGDR